MDAFFASIEQLDDPALRGKPVLVGGVGGRGVVTAASYEARVFGCRSAQPMAVALRLCPHAMVVRTRFSRYREVSNRLFELLGRFTPLVEPLSIDEAFLDVTGTERLFGPAVEVAKAIRRMVRAELGVTASVGAAPNKFLAKLASDLNKPDGLTVIPADRIDEILAPLPISRIWGVGPRTAARLEGLAIRTIGDLRKFSPEFLRQRFGMEADRYLRLGRGMDERAVTPDHQAKSIGQERTFGENLMDPEDVRSELLEHCENVGVRLRRHALRAGRITVKIRDGEFTTCTRSRTLGEATDQTHVIWNTARTLFDEWAISRFKPVRLIGVSTADLTRGDVQLGLFDHQSSEKQRRLDQALDGINDRFGKSTMRRGRTGGYND
jgi:DNA polymerase-4